MENASKALIMAGAILIAIMIISLGILIFSKMGGSAKEIANMDEQEIAAFNSKITPYLGESVSGSQVNALLQYCLSNNMAAANSGETYKYIVVDYEYRAIDGARKRLDENSQTYTRVETSGKTYKANGKYKDGLITEIVIEMNR